jgi:hypothetical protein
MGITDGPAAAETIAFVGQSTSPSRHHGSMLREMREPAGPPKIPGRDTVGSDELYDCTHDNPRRLVCQAKQRRRRVDAALPLAIERSHAVGTTPVGA